MFLVSASAIKCVKVNYEIGDVQCKFIGNTFYTFGVNNCKMLQQ